jgi:hypothetical protein
MTQKAGQKPEAKWSPGSCTRASMYPPVKLRQAVAEDDAAEARQPAV